MPIIDLPDDELAAVTAAIRRAIEDDKYPRAPRLDPLRVALARLDAASAANAAKATANASPPAKGDKRGTALKPSWCGARSEAVLRPRMPSWPGVDRLAVAATAAKASGDVGDVGGFGQGVDEDIGLMVASLTLRRDEADAVLAHVGEGSSAGRAGRGKKDVDSPTSFRKLLKELGVVSHRR
jgi:hypothetical protein